MAAGTIVLKDPGTGETGIRLFDPICFACNGYDGSGSVVEVQIQITTDADTGFATPVFDSGLVAVDSRKYGAIWAEVHPDICDPPLSPSTVYRWRMRTRNDSVETAAYPTASTFTTEAAPVSGATWRAAQ